MRASRHPAGNGRRELSRALLRRFRQSERAGAIRPFSYAMGSTARNTPGSGLTVIDMIGCGEGPRGVKRKRATRVERMMPACIIAKLAPTQTRGPAPNGRY